MEGDPGHPRFARLGQGREERADSISMSTTLCNKEVVPVVVETARVREKGPGPQQTYGQIIKSSALIGGSSVITIGLGIVRAKAMALLLGPAGVGLLGIYSSIADLARTVAGMGINSSGVRQIAEATATGDVQRIARTVTTLRRVALLLGFLGALMLVIFCVPVSRLSFGDNRHVAEVAWLGLAVLFGAVSSGQMALVQGMRRIGDLARVNILGSFYGLLVSLPLIYLYGKSGVVPSLVCAAGLGITVSWWYSRKITVPRMPMRLVDISDEVAALLRLGFVFMASGFMTMAVGYLVRIIVLRRLGEAEAGYYQSAWTLGGLYVSFILQAMAADFFPRLTAVANDNAECNRLVNEQAEVGLLIGGPGVLGTLTFAPLIIQVFYSSKFGPAVEILRWICLGMTLRVAAWPMGYIPVARGARKIFFWAEVGGNLMQVGLVWLGVLRFGLNGTGIGFFASYALFSLCVYAIVRSMSGFRWSAANKRIGLLYGVMITVVFISWYFLPRYVMVGLGALLTIFASIYSLKWLCQLVPYERLPRLVQQAVRLLGLQPRSRRD
jgi:enterobacterial common antigen flippase